MTKQVFKVARTEVIKRIREELNPENCNFCGAAHDIRVSSAGFCLEFGIDCCSKMITEANIILNEVKAKYGD